MAGPAPANTAGSISPPGIWTYNQALEWLYARQALGIKLGLEKVEALLASLGNPHHTFRAVHVAGTNGKGSVSRMMAATLQGAGHKTGLTTSPHLQSFVERIEVDGRRIREDEVAEGLLRIRPHVEALDLDGQHPTFFEVVTALAFLHFADRGCDWAVVETGMGGRLDATNVLRPAVTIITNVALDHQAYLGNTLGEIAYEKSGIMKPQTPCITAATGDALTVLMARSHELQVPMSIVGRDYAVVSSRDTFSLLRPNGESHYRVGLNGRHQHENAACVVAATEALRLLGVPIPEKALRDALAATRNPGRLEHFVIPAESLGATGPSIEVLVDGAHNPAAAGALRDHLHRIGWTRIDLVAGFCADKEWQQALDEWLPVAERVWAVPVRNRRTLQPALLERAARDDGRPAAVQPDARAALVAAAHAGARRILVAGSLFLAGEARAALTGEALEDLHGSQ